MLEIIGSMWDVKFVDAVCIPTNGILKKNGELVMGAGIAKVAKEKFPKLPKILGDYVAQYGNKVFYCGEHNGLSYLSFPTKHHWKDSSDIKLITESCKQLVRMVDKFGQCVEIEDGVQKLKQKWSTIVLPRVGCGLGGLKWSNVSKILKNYLDDKYYVITPPSQVKISPEELLPTVDDINLIRTKLKIGE